MKQPDLGKRIAYIRKEKGLTQEELVEKCNINVRTIQRIESGEVTPRPITLRLILEVLDYDFEMFSEELKATVSSTTFFSLKSIQDFFLIGFEPKKNIGYSSKQLKYAWICGLIYFLIGFPESGMEYAQYYHRFDPDLNLIYTIVKIASFITMIIMMRGFILLGEYSKNYLLKISVYLLIIHGLFTTTYYIVSVYFPHLQSEHADGGVAITLGAILLLYGTSLQKMSKQIGRAANIAGIIALISGVFFITLILWWMGLILLIPLELLEIVILYKGYEMFMEEVTLSES